MPQTERPNRPAGIDVPLNGPAPRTLDETPGFEEKRLWVLGARDPEMALIERILHVLGETYTYATVDGERVQPFNAYRADGLAEFEMPSADFMSPPPKFCVVECGGPIAPNFKVWRCDHHKPGDHGYGAAPLEYFGGSSIGQVLHYLAMARVFTAEQVKAIGLVRTRHERNPRWPGNQETGMVAIKLATKAEKGPDIDWYEPTLEIRLTAAADHCLAHAYRGECPGVDPDELFHHRVNERAQFQGRSPEQVVADINLAIDALWQAPEMELACYRHFWCGRDECHGGYPGGECSCNCETCIQPDLYVTCRDLRDIPGKIPELPEASAKAMECYITKGLPGRDGRVKVICQSGIPIQIKAFMNGWAPANGLTEIYGDPARGFAGGYLPQEDAS